MDAFIQSKFLTPFIFGFCSYFLLKLWKKAKNGCFVTIFLLWINFVWFGIVGLMLRQTPESYTIAFFVGFFIVASLKIFSLLQYFQDVLQTLFWTITDRWRLRQREKMYHRNTERERENEYDQTKAQEEKARREQEARDYRERQKRANGKKYEDETKKRKETEEKTEIRSYEQILGLSIGWTQEDLKNAYKRECQRTHPDKWIGKTEELKKIMEEEYKAVQEAYKKLKR